MCGQRLHIDLFKSTNQRLHIDLFKSTYQRLHIDLFKSTYQRLHIDLFKSTYLKHLESGRLYKTDYLEEISVANPRKLSRLDNSLIRSSY